MSAVPLTAMCHVALDLGLDLDQSVNQFLAHAERAAASAMA